MDINWSRYIEIARAQDLGSAEVARLIRTETRRKVNISEVKRRLSISDPAAAQSRQDNSLVNSRTRANGVLTGANA